MKVWTGSTNWTLDSWTREEDVLITVASEALAAAYARAGADEITSDVLTEHRMSTGVSGGDGKQASHWKADELTGTYIGIMDPTLASGVVELITPADRRAMDLIGYDVAIPEPTSLAALACAALLLLRRRTAI